MTKKREKYRAGVIGCSGVGTRHAMGLVKLPNVELVAGADLVRKTLNSFTEKFSKHSDSISGYTNYQEMLLQCLHKFQELLQQFSVRLKDLQSDHLEARCLYFG